MRRTHQPLSRARKIAWLFCLTSAMAPLISGCTPDEDLPPRNEPFKSISTAPEFDGTLLAVSDADMKAEGYVTGRVGRPGRQRDTLTVFPFSGPDKTAKGEIFASNSVMGWPQVLEPSPDGRYAYVVETRGEFPNEIERYANLYEETPTGSRLSVFDIQDPLAPKLVAELDAGVNPLSVSVTPDGQYLLTTSMEPGAEIVIYHLKGGLPTERYTFAYSVPLPDVEAKSAGIRAIVFHPSGRFLAASISDHQVAFLKVVFDAKGVPISVEPHGNTIDKYLEDAGTAISSGQFSNDGRFFLVPDIGWGHQTALEFLFSDRGKLISIAFSEDGNHRVVDEEVVGWSPEGFSLSHDNTMAATINMERTPAAGTFPAGYIAQRTTFSSISLMTFDHQTGQLDKVDEQLFRGILPEDVVFDADDDALAATIYQFMEYAPDAGFVEFWEIDRSGLTPQLVRTGNALPTTRGVHDLAVVHKTH